MKLNNKQKKLLEFVKNMHGDQVRKYTGEPYWRHVYSVAEIVSQYEDNAIEIAMCHDLFEDTTCDFSKLHKEMVQIGYDRSFAYKTCTHVNELTDKFTHEDYPYFNRNKRKILESNRLSETSSISQSVKYADMIDNTRTIVKYDRDFSKIYLKEKEYLLSVMVNGNKELLEKCKKQIDDRQL